jgi:hypothetical protein
MLNQLVKYCPFLSKEQMHQDYLAALIHYEAGRNGLVSMSAGAVVGGDYFFFLLSIADHLKIPVSFDLGVALHFFEMELSEASGYISLLFGIIGALYSLKKVQPPLQNAHSFQFRSSVKIRRVDENKPALQRGLIL